MSLVKSCSSIRVSSVLNRDTKQYGKKFLCDGNPDTCWNSDQGKHQWVKFVFDNPMDLEDISKLVLHLQFQGGFSCKHCKITALNENGMVVSSSDCYPEDVNSVQMFSLCFKIDDKDDQSSKCISELKISFKELTDFFGRVTLYLVDILKENS